VQDIRSLLKVRLEALLVDQVVQVRVRLPVAIEMARPVETGAPVGVQPTINVGIGLGPAPCNALMLVVVVVPVWPPVGLVVGRVDLQLEIAV